MNGDDRCATDTSAGEPAARELAAGEQAAGEQPAGRPADWAVVDASVLAVALTDDGPDGDLARRRLSGHRLAAPSTVDLELLAVWHCGAASGAIPERRIDLAMADLTRLPITRVPPVEVLVTCWDKLGDVTPWEAPYLALAEALDAPLITAEPRLAGAAHRARIDVLH